jgi:hypothetical protein
MPRKRYSLASQQARLQRRVDTHLDRIAKYREMNAPRLIEIEERELAKTLERVRGLESQRRQ